MQHSYPYCPPDNIDKEIQLTPRIWFQLTNAGDDNVDDSFISDTIEEDNDSRRFEGTIVPVTPYVVITAAGMHKDRRCDNGLSEFFDVNPVHKQWIHQAMFDDWEINSPHPWLICTTLHLIMINLFI
jgi:hypothetical protein